MGIRNQDVRGTLLTEYTFKSSSYRNVAWNRLTRISLPTPADIFNHYLSSDLCVHW